MFYSCRSLGIAMINKETFKKFWIRIVIHDPRILDAELDTDCKQTVIDCFWATRTDRQTDRQRDRHT